jgi:hypothetical protein
MKNNSLIKYKNYKKRKITFLALLIKCSFFHRECSNIISKNYIMLDKILFDENKENININNKCKKDNLFHLLDLHDSPSNNNKEDLFNEYLSNECLFDECKNELEVMYENLKNIPVEVTILNKLKKAINSLQEIHKLFNIFKSDSATDKEDSFSKLLFKTPQNEEIPKDIPRAICSKFLYLFEKLLSIRTYLANFTPIQSNDIKNTASTLTTSTDFNGAHDYLNSNTPIYLADAISSLSNTFNKLESLQSFCESQIPEMFKEINHDNNSNGEHSSENEDFFFENTHLNLQAENNEENFDFFAHLINTNWGNKEKISPIKNEAKEVKQETNHEKISYKPKKVSSFLLINKTCKPLQNTKDHINKKQKENQNILRESNGLHIFNSEKYKTYFRQPAPSLEKKPSLLKSLEMSEEYFPVESNLKDICNPFIKIPIVEPELYYHKSPATPNVTPSELFYSRSSLNETNLLDSSYNTSLKSFFLQENRKEEESNSYTTPKKIKTSYASESESPNPYSSEWKKYHEEYDFFLRSAKKTREENHIIINCIQSELENLTPLTYNFVLHKPDIIQNPLVPSKETLVDLKYKTIVHLEKQEKEKLTELREDGKIEIKEKITSPLKEEYIANKEKDTSYNMVIPEKSDRENLSPLKTYNEVHRQQNRTPLKQQSVIHLKENPVQLEENSVEVKEKLLISSQLKPKEILQLEEKSLLQMEYEIITPLKEKYTTHEGSNIFEKNKNKQEINNLRVRNFPYIRKFYKENPPRNSHRPISTIVFIPSVKSTPDIKIPLKVNNSKHYERNDINLQISSAIVIILTILFILNN